MKCIKKIIIYLCISIAGLLFPLSYAARIMAMAPIICQNNIEELQRNASTAYLVELPPSKNQCTDLL